jgi:hypothetical protein
MLKKFRQTSGGIDLLDNSELVWPAVEEGKFVANRVDVRYT